MRCPATSRRSSRPLPRCTTALLKWSFLQRSDVNKQDAATAGQEDEAKNYFCSELVASALQHMGLMLNKKQSTFFWPACALNP